MRNLNKHGVTWTQKNARSQIEPWASEDETQEFLYAMVRAVKPLNILEIGTFEGDSAIAMGQAIKSNGVGHLWTIDYKDYKQIQNIKEANLDKIVTCLIGDAKTEVEKIIDKKFDLVFIDDGHSSEDVMRDLKLANKVTKQHSYILGHDVINIPDVSKALNDFLKDNNFEKTIITTYAGIFILRKI